MGCCVPIEKEMVIKSNIPFTDKELLENEKKNSSQKDFNSNLIVVEPKTKSDKTLDFVNQKENNKIGRKHRKSMNALKEISYNEICNCAKYF